MGYFSELDLEMRSIERDLDYSYPSPEQQLQWRIEDLNDRLEAFGMKCPSDDVLRGYDIETVSSSIEYMLPECLDNTRDVLVALAIAYRKLRCRCLVFNLEEASMVSSNDEISHRKLVKRQFIIERAA